MAVMQKAEAQHSGRCSSTLLHSLTVLSDQRELHCTLSESFLSCRFCSGLSDVCKLKQQRQNNASQFMTKGNSWHPEHTAVFTDFTV